MATTLSIRIDSEMEGQLRAAAAAAGMSVSEFTRRCLARRLEEVSIDRAKLAWESGKDLFGKHRSGRSDLSERCEEILFEAFDEKRRHRR